MNNDWKKGGNKLLYIGNEPTYTIIVDGESPLETAWNFSELIKEWFDK